MIRLQILGCSGGIGGDLRATSMLLDNDVLIDAGTGVGDLSLQQMAQIDHIFLPHSHLDHATSMLFLLDTVSFQRSSPVTLYATQETLDILSAYSFNWQIWPDFRVIPDAKAPILHYSPVRIGEPVELGKGRRVTPLPANHVVPAVGYQLDSGRGALVFTGDTTTNPSLLDYVNKINNLKFLIIESAVSDGEHDLAVASKHRCPGLLADELARLSLDPAIYVTHFKLREAELIMEQITTRVPHCRAHMLQQNQLFEF